MNNSFYEVLDSIGSSDEIKFIKTDIKDPKRQQEIVEFIKKNNIDCNHLWEDSEEGDRSTDDWNKLVEYVYDL